MSGEGTKGRKVHKRNLKGCAGKNDRYGKRLPLPGRFWRHDLEEQREDGHAIAFAFLKSGEREYSQVGTRK